MTKKISIILVTVTLFGAFLAWLFIESSKPLPGEKVLQDGRNHVPEGSKVDYKSNPPTSGDHYGSWITKGFYETPRLDGNLVHSLEHGYIIIWYDCENKLTIDNGQWTKKKFSIFNFQLSIVAYAQASTMTAGSEGSPSAKLEDLPESFRNNSCDKLKSQLKDVYQKFGPHKLIVMPRVGMDSIVVLTAWGRVEKLNNVDRQNIKEFINAFRDNGPEQTNEP